MKFNFSRRLALLIAGLCLAGTVQAFRGPSFDALKGAVAGSTTAPAPASGQIEIGFSPEGTAEALVLKTIGSARKTIRLAAYSFTSPAVVRALLDAKRRGVEVGVIVDEKHNREERSGKARAALSALVNAGIPTRTIADFQIFHDKFLVVDSLHVQTGSFNYSASAASRNSENVIVLWNNPQAAATYLQHWHKRYEQGADYRPGYY